MNKIIGKQGLLKSYSLNVLSQVLLEKNRIWEERTTVVVVNKYPNNNT